MNNIRETLMSEFNITYRGARKARPLPLDVRERAALPLKELHH